MKRSKAALIDELECRRLLAVFSATEGNDIIRVTSSNQTTLVTINGNTQSSTDLNVTVLGLGGNDSVYFPALVKTQAQTARNILVNMGEGDDYATNYDNISGVASFTNLDFGIHIDGDAGFDILSLDNTNSGGFTRYVMNSQGHVQLGTTTAGALIQNSNTQKIIIDGSNYDDSISLIGKRFPEQQVVVNGQGGNDEFGLGYAGGFIWGAYFQPYPFSLYGWTPATTTVTGGMGNDTLYVADYGGSAGNYYQEFSTYVKGSLGFTYTGINAQHVYVPTGSQMTFSTMPGSIVETTVHTSGSTINIGNGTLNNLAAGTFEIDASGNSSVVNVFDYATPTDQYYVMNEGQFARGGIVVNFHAYALSGFNISAGNGADTVSINKTYENMTVGVFGNGGNDTLSIGGLGGIDLALLGRVDCDGGSGADTYYVYNANDSTVTTAELTSSSFKADAGVTHNYYACEQATIAMGGGDTTLNVLGSSIPMTLSTGNGNDGFNIGAGTFASSILGNIIVNAGNGDDSVNVDDHLDTAGGSAYQVGSVGLSRGAGTALISLSGVDHTTVNCGSGFDTVIVNGSMPDLSINTGAGNDGVSVFASGGVVTVNTGPEQADFFVQGDSCNVNIDSFNSGDVGASVRFLQDDQLFSLGTFSMGTSIGNLQIGAGATVVATNTLSLTTGRMDLAGGTLVKRAAAVGPTLAQLRTAITNGYNGGAWNGTSSGATIHSSLAAGSSTGDAVGYGLGSEIAPTSLGGFAIAPGDVVMRYTLDGDANLDKSVNGADFNILATNFGTGNKGWSKADFTYDAAGSVNGADFNILAGSFGGTSAGDGSLARGGTGGGIGGSSGGGSAFGGGRHIGDDDSDNSAGTLLR